MEPYTLDITPWIDRFPLADPTPPEAWRVSGAGSLASVAYFEQLRARVTAQHDLGRSVPADVFVYGIGEAPRRDMMKVGGLPYRPAGKPWPLDATGRPMTFLAQFRFAESHDIVGETPGDVLLVFVSRPDIAMGRPREIMAFEWYPLGLDDLVGPDEVPKPEWTFVTCYGVRHRSCDYIEPKAFDAVMRVVPSLKELRGHPREWVAEAFCRIAGPKVGGHPHCTKPTNPEHRWRSPGKFLCGMDTIRPEIGPYPWINQPEPIPLRMSEKPELILDIGDGFLLNFSLDEAGQVHWVIQHW